MDSEKAKKFEKHRKEMQKLAFLNAAVITFYLAGLALFLGGYAQEFMYLLVSVQPTVFVSGLFVTMIIFMWAMPIFHYREERKAVTDKDREYYRERGLAEDPTVEVLEERGWEEVEVQDDRVVLETYVSPFHRLINRKTTVIMEKEDEDENSETYVLKTEKEEISRTKIEYHERNDRNILTETTVSLNRVSPVYLEINIFLEPQIEGLIEDVAEEDLEIENEDIDVGFRRYELN